MFTSDVVTSLGTAMGGHFFNGIFMFYLVLKMIEFALT